MNWYIKVEMCIRDRLDSSYRMGNLDPRFYGGEPIWNTAERQGVRTASFYWVGSEVPLASGDVYKRQLLTPFSGILPVFLAF